MLPPKKQVCFREREFKGSRLRCLLLTSKSRETVRSFLQELVAPHAELNGDANWLPEGFLAGGEVNLDQQSKHEFLTDDQREGLAVWWLKNRRGATTPTWDIVAQCKISGKPGLVLVEAKAHGSELGADDSCKSENEDNRGRIAEALTQANEGLSHALPGWSLQRDSHYQLSNRFALSWKIASMKVPVVLVYLGFLDAWDMNDGARTILKSPEQWRDRLLQYAGGTVPAAAWENRLDINGTPLIPLIRAARIEVSADYCPAS